MASPYTNTIQLSGKKETKIKVDCWPNRTANWRVSSAARSDGKQGRGLLIVGWGGTHTTSGFKTGYQAAAWVDLHLEDDKPLLVYNHRFAPSLIDGDKDDALGAMVACAVDLAEVLKVERGVGNGHVEWRFAKSDAFFEQLTRRSKNLRPVRGSYKTPGDHRYLSTQPSEPS